MSVVRGTFEVKNKLGLHARAATKLVQLASRFPCEIVISRAGQTANAKSVMGVLLLCGSKGTKLALEAARRRRCSRDRRAREVDRQSLRGGRVTGRRSPVPESGLRSAVLEGIAGSLGYAIAPAVVVDVRRHGVVRRHIPKRSADDEIARFDDAVTLAASELRTAEERARSRAIKAESGILEAYVLMVQDEMLHAEVERRIRIDLLCAEWALERGDRRDGGAAPPGQRSVPGRAQSRLRVRRRSLARCARRQAVRASPSPTSARPASWWRAICRRPKPSASLAIACSRSSPRSGTRTSHTSILARALEIPAVVGVHGPARRASATATSWLVDGLRGRVVVNPIADADRGVRRARAAASGVRAQAPAQAPRSPASSRAAASPSICAPTSSCRPRPSSRSTTARGASASTAPSSSTSIARSRPTEDEQYETYRASSRRWRRCRSRCARSTSAATSSRPRFQCRSR